ncbi:protein kinase [Diaporthe amygdali]|uniref:protein kinase n=1 Tax=Phomopsis amygdali TaxID=1214568 RepID=UPI0022FE9F2F|nr:protein kinase [Diaporthe amygdali]KAJ0115718.1 protein kinase [Diaporthe amygdali]
MARNASCSNGIIIQLSNPVEKDLIEPVLDLGLRKTHFGLRKFFIGKRDITTHRPPPPGCNHEHRLARKKRSLAQSLKHPHLQEIETAIEHFIQDHNLDYQDELNVRTVVTDIRLLGQGDSRQVRLQPRGWVICRPEVVEVVKDIVAKFPSTIPQNLNLGSKIQAGRGGLSWTMADVTHMPETLNMGAGFDLPTHGYKFFLSLEDPIDISRPRRSSCGLLCFVVVEKGGSRELAQVCRIGGVVEIPDQNGSRKLVAVTVAHGLSDYILAATSRKKINGPLGGSQKKGTFKLRTGEKDEVPTKLPSDKHWTPVMGFHAINWLGKVWTPTPQHPSSVSIGNLGDLTKDADFALLDVPFSLQNSFTTGGGVQSLDGLVMDHELFSLAEMDQDLGVIVELECILPATLLRETPFMFVRGRQFATRMIRLKNNKPLTRGTSGCWVVRGNKLCGMIVASHDVEPIAHIVSAEKLFSDINRTVGHWPDEIHIGGAGRASQLQAEISTVRSEEVDRIYDQQLPFRQSILSGLPRSFSPAEEASMVRQSQISFEDLLLLSMEESAGEGNERRFLPHDVLESLVDYPLVYDYLAKPMKIERQKLSVLVDYVLRSARKLFAILVLTEACEILEDLRAEGLSDDDLPFLFDGRHFYRRDTDLSPETEEALRLNSFKRLNRSKIGFFDTEQWSMLAPRFTLDDSGEALFYRLHRNIVLPWVASDRMIETGRSTIRRVRIHPAHFDFSRVSNATEFAVKELRSLTEEAFNMEIESKERYRGDFGVLKISDFGETRFHQAETRMRHQPSTTAVTMAYSAPEFEQEPDGPVSRAYDVWSLGCVYLEFATWLLLGAQGVEDFAQDRLKEGRQSRGDIGVDNFFRMVASDGSSPGNIRANTRLSPVVKECVKERVRILQNISQTHPDVDPALNGFLNLVLERMLVTGEHRAKSLEVLNTLQFLFRELRDKKHEGSLFPTSSKVPEEQSTEQMRFSTKPPDLEHGTKNSQEDVSDAQGHETIEMKALGPDPFELKGLPQPVREQKKTSSSNSIPAVQVFSLEQVEEEIEEVVRETDPTGAMRETRRRSTRRTAGLGYAKLHQGAKASAPGGSKVVDPDSTNFSAMSELQLLEAERALLGQLMAIKDVQIQREGQTGPSIAMNPQSGPNPKHGEGSQGLGSGRKTYSEMLKWIMHPTRRGPFS